MFIQPIMYHEVLVNTALEHTEQKGDVTILNVVVPHHQIKALSENRLSSDQKVIFQLEKLERKLVNHDEALSKEDIFQAFGACLNEGLDQQIKTHLKGLLEEIVNGSYEISDIREYLGWYCRLTLTCLKGESTLLDEKVQGLYKKVINEKYDITLRESEGHSPSYFLTDEITKRPFAILKQSHPEITSSFTKHLPKMPLSATVWEHELIGLEQDQLFGFNRVPTTLTVRFKNGKNEEVNGVIQEFVSDSKSGWDFYNPSGADLLKAIPKSHVQVLTLSGLFKGISAGHLANYILQLDGNKEKVTTLFEIDLEEMLLPYNKLSDVDDLVVSDQLSTKKEEAIKSLILCRMWILGLPQNGMPFDRAALMAMSHPSMLSLLQSYHKQASKYSRMDEGSWQAQYERVRMMQEICLSELEKATITLTPRDLYFKIFGGEHLWKIAQEKGYPPLIAFNNLVSDPYQHILKDFSDPTSIPECKRLKEPKDDKPESKDIMNFFRKMEGLEQK